MFRVIWNQAALDGLARVWLRLGPAGRRSVTAAANEIDARLGRSADEAGEGREGITRIDFVPPLGLTFDVHAADGFVRVLRVWLVTR